MSSVIGSLVSVLLLCQVPPQTPVAALWEDGEWSKSAWGKQARDLTADVIGVRADELRNEILARVPKYNPTAQRLP